MAKTHEALLQELGEIDAAIAASPDQRAEVADRIFDVMKIAPAAGAKPEFLMGQVFEALLPMRRRASLQSAREKVLKDIRAAAGSDARES